VIINTLFFLLATGAVLFAAHRVSLWLHPDRPWTRLLDAAVIAVLEVVLLSHLFGSVGLLRPGFLLVGAVFLAGIAWRFVPKPTVTGFFRWLLPPWVTLALAVFGTGMLAVTLGRPTTGLDTLQYHYPLVAEWIAATDLTTPVTFGIGNYAWYYPSNIELTHLWTVIWFQQDFLISLVSWVFFGLAIAAVAGVVRRLGGNILTGTLTGVGFVTLPTIWGSQIRSGQVDLAVSAFLLLGVFYFLGYRDERHTKDAAMGGLCLGLAAGSKYIALPQALLIGFLFLMGMLWLARHKEISSTQVARVFSVMALATATAGSFWYLRNWLQTGSPLYPVSLLGEQMAYGPVPAESIDFTILDYLIQLDFHRWILMSWPLLTWVGGAIAVAALFVLPFWAIRSSQASDRPDGFLLVAWVLPFLSFIAYLITPTSAGGPEGLPALFAPNIRYAIPFLAFGVIGAITATATTRPSRGQTLAFILVLSNLAHLGLRFLGLPFGGPLPAETLLQGLVLGVLATAAGFTAFSLIRTIDFTQPLVNRAGVVILATGSLAGAFSAHHFSIDQRFGFVNNDYGRAAFQYLIPKLEAEHPEGVTIAHSGLAHNYPLYGSKLQNKVLLSAKTDKHAGTPRAFATAQEFYTWTCTHAVDWVVARDDILIAQIDDEELLERAGTSKEEIETAIEELGGDGVEPEEAQWAKENPALYILDHRDGNTHIFQVDKTECP